MTAISGFGEGVAWDDEWAGIGGGKPKGSSSNAKAHDLGALFQTAVYVQRQESGWRLKPMDRNEDGTAGGPGDSWAHDNMENRSADSSDNSSENSTWERRYNVKVRSDEQGNTSFKGQLSAEHKETETKFYTDLEVNNRGEWKASVGAEGTW